MFKPKSLLCLPCVAAMDCPGGPNAGREGSMEACGPTKRLMIVMGETVAILTATLTTDMPGKSIYLIPYTFRCCWHVSSTKFSKKMFTNEHHCHDFLKRKCHCQNHTFCFLNSFTTPESTGPVSRCGRRNDWGSQVDDDEMRRDVQRDMHRYTKYACILD